MNLLILNMIFIIHANTCYCGSAGVVGSGVEIFKAVNEWTAGVLGFQCGEDTGGGYLTNISLGGNF